MTDDGLPVSVGWTWASGFEVESGLGPFASMISICLDRICEIKHRQAPFSDRHIVNRSHND